MNICIHCFYRVVQVAQKIGTELAELFCMDSCKIPYNIDTTSGIRPFYRDI